jgi:hypothetical protein
MSGLPRELLKWLQSLDLSYSVKNPKRDFANGWLIAEILSRYFKGEIYMHSFDNGTSLAKKIANWELLERFFERHEMAVDRSLIPSLMHAQPAAATNFIQQLYTILTHKTLQHVKPIKDIEYIPAFARPTASQLVKDRLKEPTVENLKDERLINAEAANVINQHNQAVKAERAAEPQRFSLTASTRVPKSSVSKKVSEGKQRNSAMNQQGGNISFKEIKVKQLETNAAIVQVRAPNDHKSDHSLISTPSLPVVSSSVPLPAPAADSTLDFLSVSLTNFVSSSSYAGRIAFSLPPAPAPIIQLMDSIDSFPPEFIEEFCVHLSDSAIESLAAASIQQPKEFWLLFGLLFTGLLNSPPHSPSLSSLLHLSVRFASTLQHMNSYATWHLYCDYAIPKIQNSFSTPAFQEKFDSLLPLLVAFSDQPARAIRKLREILSTIHYLRVLIAFHVSPDTLTLFVESAEFALQKFLSEPPNEETALQAIVAIRLLSSLMGSDSAVVIDAAAGLWPLLDRVGQSTVDWRVHVALVEFSAAALLPHSTADSNHLEPLLSTVEAFLEGELSPNAPLPLLRAGVALLTPLLPTRPSLRSLFVQRFLDRADVRQSCLHEDEANGRPSASLPDSHPLYRVEQEFLDSIPILRHIWSPLLIGQTICDHVKSTAVDNLNVAHVDLLACALADLDVEETLNEPDVNEWQRIFRELRDHLLVELADPAFVEPVIGIFKCFLSHPQIHSVALPIFLPTNHQPPPIYGILKFLYPGADPACRSAVAQWFNQLLAASEDENAHGVGGFDFNVILTRLLENFKQFEPEKFDNSELRAVWLRVKGLDNGLQD